MKSRILLLMFGLLIIIGTPTLIRGDDVPSEAEELYVHRVRGILKAKCFACHGEKPDDIKGGFDMSTRKGFLQPGDSGDPAIVPGKPDESYLISAIKWESSEMPPKENDRLTPEQIRYFEAWVKGGAPWPSEDRIQQILETTSDKWDVAGGVTVQTSGGLDEEWTNRKYDPENLWAYQPLWRDAQGLLNQTDKHPVDFFVARKADELNLPLAPRADRRTLIRRATFDLLGLPPTPRQIDEFINDPASDEAAFRKVIDRLLESPHYGERMAQHWLDVVRYADSSGYANDYERGSAWRYRDYVVRAFNEDKPYDQFIREQIAGDEIDPNDPEMLVAAGFLRMGPWELTGMEVEKIARQRFLDDVTDAVGQVFLGHMLQCAKCHDHKFDPVPTRDYYSIQAAFATTQLAEREAPFLEEENTDWLDEQKYLDQRRQHYQSLLKRVGSKITIEAAREWFEEYGRDPQPFEATLAELQKQNKDGKVSVNDVRKRMQRKKIDPALIPPKQVGFAPEDYGLERIGRKGLSRLNWRYDRYKPYALSVYSGKTPTLRAVYSPLRMPDDPMKKGAVEKTAILVGGDPFSPSQPVQPGVLSAVEYIDEKVGAANQSETSLPQQVTGRRKALADWIADEENPLTARVMANRIWQWHFGQALAGNPNNFGTTGKKPSHPELLDHLANEFMDNGWSVKTMHRLIMTSDAYQRASVHPDPKALANNDPNGISYAVFQPRRLTAEEMRDAMLSVSGELNPQLGGIPIRPEMNLEAALQPRMVMGTFAEAWQPSRLPEQRHRRSLYAMKVRGHRDPFMEVFNSPSPDLSCEAREASTVTPQVFSLFNSEITFDRALALANRVMNEEKLKDDQRRAMERVFRLTMGRAATDAELEMCLDHWQQMTKKHRGINFAKPDYPTEVVREAVEENTGEKFTFVEPLEVYQDFVPDLKPADAGPELRGLAEICLVLLNSNEFAYIY